MIRFIARTIIAFIILNACFYWGVYKGIKDFKAAALRAEVALINKKTGDFEFKRAIRFDKCNKDGSC